MGLHNVHLVEGLVATRTLAHAVGQPCLDAAGAEEVAASLEDAVLEVFAADGAERKILSNSG